MDKDFVLGEQSKWKIFQYLILIGDYKAAFSSLFWKKPRWKVSILYTNGDHVTKVFDRRSDAYNYVVNEGDHVSNYALYQE